MAKRGTKVNIAHQPWKVRFGKPMRGHWGHIEYDKREIVIHPKCEEKGIDREVLLHEVLHALFPWLDEEVVVDAGICIDDVLEACGY
jgi:hypothetical protein